MDTNRLEQTLGVEYTWLTTKKTPRPTDEERFNHWGESFNVAEVVAPKIHRAMLARGFKHYACHMDDSDVVEIPTPPLKSISAHRTWWVRAQRFVRPHHLVTHSSASMSGGAHVHVGVNGLSLQRRARVVFNTFRDLYNRPYLSWVFNHPDDNLNSKWLGAGDCYTCRRMPTGRAREYYADHRCFMMYMLGEVGMSDLDAFERRLYLDDKDRALRYDSNTRTLEFRFFDMPRCWSEARAQLIFAERYFNWIKRQTQDGALIEVDKRLSKRGLKRTTKVQVVKEFKALLRQLDLEYSDYEVFVRRNLTPRMAHRSYLV